MNYEVDFLNRLYQNSKMGEHSIDVILKSVKNPRLQYSLQKQKEGYSQLSRKAERQIHLKREVPQDNSRLTRLSSAIGIHMNTLTNKKPSHLAQMLIQGSTIGMIDATQHLHKYQYVSPKVKGLANEMIQFEEENIQKLKHFL